MDFIGVLGHQKQVELLKADLQSGNLAHAYLFAGPSDIGKFKVALDFTKALQTLNLDESETILIKNQINQGVHFDTIILRNDGESLKIEQIRRAILDLNMTGNSNYRVLVIEEIERMTPECSNALLKILEEPPGKVLFVFTTVKIHLILETILSRMRIVHFSIFKEEELMEHLVAHFKNYGVKQLARFAELSLGRIGLAIKLIEHQDLFESYEQMYNEVENFLKEKDIVAGFGFIESIHSDKMLVEMFIEIASVILRKQMLQSVQKSEDYVTLNRKVAMVEELEKIRALSETNVNSRLMLENLLLQL